MVDTREIEAVVEQVVAQFHPERVILFGSYAYGEMNDVFMHEIVEKGRVLYPA